MTYDSGVTSFFSHKNVDDNHHPSRQLQYVSVLKDILQLDYGTMSTDAPPSSLLDPLEGPTMWKCESSWNLVPFPTSSTKGGERGVLKVPGLD